MFSLKINSTTFEFTFKHLKLHTVTLISLYAEMADLSHDRT